MTFSFNSFDRFSSRDRIEKIDILFSNEENKINWEKHFLESKKILRNFQFLNHFFFSFFCNSLVENGSERRIFQLQHILPLANCRSGSEVSPLIRPLYAESIKAKLFDAA